MSTPAPSPATPDPAEPDSTVARAAEPDDGAAQPDAAQPDAARPDAARPDAAQPDAAAAPSDGVAKERDLEYLVDPTQRRRAPRYGRIMVLGMLAGVVVAAVLALIPGDSRLSTGNLFALLLITCVPLGLLAGAITGLVLDRRSMRRADHARGGAGAHATREP